MAAEVVIGAQGARLIAQHDDAFAGNLDQSVVSPGRERAVTPDTDPVAPENSFSLVRKNVRRRVVTTWERACPLLVAVDCLEKGGHRSVPPRGRENDARGIATSRAGDAAARMCPRTAEIQPLERRTIATPAGHG